MRLDPAIHTTQPLPKRERLRAELLAKIPSWYRPWAHLAGPSLFGIGAVVTAVWSLANVQPLEWLAVPGFWLLINMFEWHIHRDILHRSMWPLGVLFYRHTPEHHVVFVKDDMAMRDPREFRLVLIPSYGIVAIFLTTLPVTATLAALVSANVAALWVAASMSYIVSYEWLHLAYHLPATSRIGQSAPVRALRRNHAMHHTPELMQQWNFNVTVPLWDWVRGSIHPGTFGEAPVSGTISRPNAAG